MVSPILIPVIFVSSIPIIAIGYPLARAIASRLERQPVGSGVPSDVALRLERMEQAIDTIAVEIERISEGQRFTTKLLSDRATPDAPSGGERG
ncbi:MAG: hypothetical protein V4550_20605 [Gemmatimonadota bacterium]